MKFMPDSGSGVYVAYDGDVRCVWDGVHVKPDAFAEKIAALKAERDRLRGCVEWVASQSNLFFAECSQAEEIVARCAEALRPSAEARAQKDRVTIREHCRLRRPLDGTDAQMLEHALTMTERERDQMMMHNPCDCKACLAVKDLLRKTREGR